MSANQIRMGHMPIGRQIVLLVLLALTVVFVALTLVVTRLSMRHAVENTETSLLQQSSTIQSMLSAYYANVSARGQRQSELLGRFMPGHLTVGNNTVLSNSVALPELRVGDLLINNNHEFLEKFKAFAGSEAAFLAFKEGALYRAATLLKKDGQFMDGSQIPASDPVAAALTKGEEYRGLTYRNGKYYFSVVTPIKDAAGKVQGGISVRISLDTELQEIRSSLSKIQSGQTGYVYILRPTGDSGSLADFILHPSLQGKTVGEVNNPNLTEAISSILGKGEGTHQYPFADKDGRVQTKIVALVKIPGWNWVVGVGSWLDEYLTEAYQLRNIILISGAVSALVMALLVYYAVGLSLSPLRHVLAAVERLGAGDFSHARTLATADSKNEVTQVLHALDNAASRVRQLLGKIKESAAQVQVASTQVQESVQEMQASSDTEAQSAANIAATIEQVSTSIDCVAESTQEIEHLAGNTKQVTGETTASIMHTVATMEGIAAQLGSSADLVRSLGERSQDVSKIVSVIGEIADQTNLLALNAAIEAARAGESGRGFAVVADEVRKLAERTANATKEISSTINIIVADTTDAAQHMEKVSTQMQTGVSQVTDARASIEKLNEQAETSLGDVRSIANATREQSSAVQSVVSTVEQLAALSEENAAAAEHNLRQANALREVAETMQRELSAFRT